MRKLDAQTTYKWELQDFWPQNFEAPFLLLQAPALSKHPAPKGEDEVASTNSISGCNGKYHVLQLSSKYTCMLYVASCVYTYIYIYIHIYSHQLKTCIAFLCDCTAVRPIMGGASLCNSCSPRLQAPQFPRPPAQMNRNDTRRRRRRRKSKENNQAHNKNREGTCNQRLFPPPLFCSQGPFRPFGARTSEDRRRRGGKPRENCQDKLHLLRSTRKETKNMSLVVSLEGQKAMLKIGSVPFGQCLSRTCRFLGNLGEDFGRPWALNHFLGGFGRRNPGAPDWGQRGAALLLFAARTREGCGLESCRCLLD